MKKAILSTLFFAVSASFIFADDVVETNITVNGLTFHRVEKGAASNKQFLVTDITGTLKTGIDTNELDGASVADIRISNSGRDVTIKAKNPDKDDSLKGMVLIRMPEDTVDQSTLNYTNAADTIVIDGKTYRMMPLMSAKTIDKKLARLLPRWTKTAAEALPTIPVTSTTVTPNDLINGYEAIRTFLINNSVDAITTETAAPATGPAIIGGKELPTAPSSISYLGNTFTKGSDGKYKVDPQSGINLKINSSYEGIGLEGYPNIWDIGFDSSYLDKTKTEWPSCYYVDEDNDIFYYIQDNNSSEVRPTCRYNNISLSSYFTINPPTTSFATRLAISEDDILNGNICEITPSGTGRSTASSLCPSFDSSIGSRDWNGSNGWYMNGSQTSPGNCTINSTRCWALVNSYVPSLVILKKNVRY